MFVCALSVSLLLASVRAQVTTAMPTSPPLATGSGLVYATGDSLPVTVHIVATLKKVAGTGPNIINTITATTTAATTTTATAAAATTTSAAPAASSAARRRQVNETTTPAAATTTTTTTVAADGNGTTTTATTTAAAGGATTASAPSQLPDLNRNTTVYKRAIFGVNVDTFARLTVTDSFNWARSQDFESVNVWLEFNDARNYKGFYSGFAGDQTAPVLTFQYMREASFVVPYVEFLVFQACETNANFTCGQVAAASIVPQDASTCITYMDEIFQPLAGDNERGLCMRPAKLYDEKNETTVLPDITIYLAWKGRDSNGRTFSSSRSLPSTFQQYSIAPISDALGRISNDVSSLFG